MKRKTVFAAVVFALAMLVSTPVAHATTVTEAQAMLSSLRANTEAVAISGKSAETKDRPGLLGKLDEASLKVNQAKFCDSIQKLNDFKVKVNQLIAGGKINQDPALGTTGQELLTDADAAIAGLRDLVAQSGATCAF